MEGKRLLKSIYFSSSVGGGGWRWETAESSPLSNSDKAMPGLAPPLLFLPLSSCSPSRLPSLACWHRAGGFRERSVGGWRWGWSVCGHIACCLPVDYEWSYKSHNSHVAPLWASFSLLRSLLKRSLNDLHRVLHISSIEIKKNYLNKTILKLLKYIIPK